MTDLDEGQSGPPPITSYAPGFGKSQFDRSFRRYVEKRCLTFFENPASLVAHETAAELLRFFLESACKAQSDMAIMRGREAIQKLPRNWLFEKVERPETPAEGSAFQRMRPTPRIHGAALDLLDWTDDYEYRRYLELLRLLQGGLDGVARKDPEDFEDLSRADLDTLTRALLLGLKSKDPDLVETAQEFAACSRCGVEGFREHLLCKTCYDFLRERWQKRSRNMSRGGINFRERVPPMEWAQSDHMGFESDGCWISSEWRQRSDTELRQEIVRGAEEKEKTVPAEERTGMKWREWLDYADAALETGQWNAAGDHAENLLLLIRSERRGQYVVACSDCGQGVQSAHQMQPVRCRECLASKKENA